MSRANHGNYHQHKPHHHIDAQSPEQDFDSGRKGSATKPRLLFGGDHLVGFEQRQHHARILQIRLRRSGAQFREIFTWLHRFNYPPSNLGNTVVTPNAIPTPTSRTVTTMPAAFSQNPFTCSPITSRSFTNRIRNASAGGIASTAITFTVSTTNSSGAWGISTSAAAAQVDPSSVE